MTEINVLSNSLENYFYKFGRDTTRMICERIRKIKNEAIKAVTKS